MSLPTSASASYTEHALTFRCEGDTLVGIVTQPQKACDIGVVIVPGGPNYRVSAHRQFTLLARRIAASGMPAMHFDFRGMGDADGDWREIGDVTADVGVAIEAFLAQCPGVQRIVLWGLCAGATNALTYLAARRDPRVAGLVLLNPWVRTEHTIAKTYIKHYYRRRLTSGSFWARLLSGDVDVRAAVGAFVDNARRAFSPASPADIPLAAFQDRMADGLAWFAGPVLLALCSDDLTAREFDEYAATADKWRGLLAKPTIRRVDIAEADHTFSSARWRAQAETMTVEWLAGQMLDVRRAA